MAEEEVWGDLRDCRRFFTPMHHVVVPIVRELIYLLVFLVSICKFSEQITGLNLFLMLSWAFAAIMRMVVGSFTYYGFDEREILYHIWWILQEINYIGFLAFLFKLKVVEIYMNPKANSEMIKD